MLRQDLLQCLGPLKAHGRDVDRNPVSALARHQRQLPVQAAALPAKAPERQNNPLIARDLETVRARKFLKRAVDRFQKFFEVVGVFVHFVSQIDKRAGGALRCPAPPEVFYEKAPRINHKNKSGAISIILRTSRERSDLGPFVCADFGAGGKSPKGRCRRLDAAPARFPNATSSCFPGRTP